MPKFIKSRPPSTIAFDALQYNGDNGEEIVSKFDGSGLFTIPSRTSFGSNLAFNIVEAGREKPMFVEIGDYVYLSSFGISAMPAKNFLSQFSLSS